jgi:hypothetical protein
LDNNGAYEGKKLKSVPKNPRAFEIKQHIKETEKKNIFALAGTFYVLGNSSESLLFEYDTF